MTTAYEQSTQYNRWRFSFSEVEKLRKNAFIEAVAHLQSPTAPVANSRKRPRSSSSSSVTSESPLSYTNSSNESITFEQSEELRVLLLFKLLSICQQAGFSKAIIATSVQLFHRFYVFNSVVLCNPNEVLYACIFLGIKVEACPYTEVYEFSEKLATIVKKSSKSNVGLREVQVLTALDFALACHHPFVNARSLLKEAIKSFFEEKGVDSKSNVEVHVKLWNHLQHVVMSVVEISLLSDLVFAFPPAMIALGVLMFVGTSSNLVKLKPLAKFWPECTTSLDSDLKSFLVQWIYKYCEKNSIEVSTTVISNVTSVLEETMGKLTKLIEREASSASSQTGYLSDPLFRHLEQVVSSKWIDATAAVIQACVKEKAKYKSEKSK
jgi:Cyclin, N-terminal domain